MLSLGIGIASSAGKGNSSLSGFGIVTLASLAPILAVLGLAVYVHQTVSVEAIKAGAAVAVATTVSWHEATPFAEVIGGVRAIVPLVLFLIFVLVFLLNEKVRHPGTIAYGIALSVLGMILFSLGLSYGLAMLGTQSGGLVPAAFETIPGIEDSPLYSVGLGIAIAVAFAWLLGFGATLAEPALNALGMTVETLSNGAFRKSMLMIAVSAGVAFGIGIGVLKIIFDIPIVYLVLPGYGLAVDHAID